MVLPWLSIEFTLFGSRCNESNAMLSSVWCYILTERKGEHTQRQHVKLFLGPRHSRGMWHVERGGGKALASECMRKLITSWEEADAVYLGFLHDYNRQASRSLNYAALQIAPNDLVPLEGGKEARGFVVGAVGGQSCVLPVRSGPWAMWRFVKRNADGF